jgi:hypothetical protein
MSRFGMGFGKDGSKHTLNTRPCVRVHSARCQQVLNKWFGTKDDKRHPDWMTTEFESPPRLLPGDKGDWALVWHPRSRPNTVTVPTRKIMHTLKDEEEKVRLKVRLAHELANGSGSSVKQREPPGSQQIQRPIQSPPRDQLASQASNRSRQLRSDRGSQRALSTAGSILKGEDPRPASSLSALQQDDVNALNERMSTSYSRASRASGASKASRRSRSSLVLFPFLRLPMCAHARGPLWRLRNACHA